MKAKLKDKFGGCWESVRIGSFGYDPYEKQPFVILEYPSTEPAFLRDFDRWYYSCPNHKYCVFEEVDDEVKTEVAIKCLM